MTRRHVGTIITGMLASIAVVFSLTVASPAVAAQTVPTSATASFTATTTAAAPAATVTPACKKATKAVKKAWKARVAAKKSGDINRFIAADRKWRKAKDARKRICSLPASAFTPPTTPEPTFSGNSKDPRPAGWVRPADGSGLPGSNASEVTFNVPNCPVTVSSFTIQPTSSATGWYFVAKLQNYTDKKYQILWRATLVDADGTTWETGVWDSDVLKAYSDGKYDLADLTFTIYPDDPFSPATSRVESFTVLSCQTV